MIFDPQLLEQLEMVETIPWAGTCYRHMFANYPPDRENTAGARWNPSGCAAIYCSLESETAIAEADYYISLQPLRPSCKRTLYTLNARLKNVAILTDWALLNEMGVTPKLFNGNLYHATQLVGGGMERLGRDGILVPSARRNGANLVIFPQNQDQDYLFEPTSFSDCG
jgi:RES domain-containing protein